MKVTDTTIKLPSAEPFDGPPLRGGRDDLRRQAGHGEGRPLEERARRPPTAAKPAKTFTEDFGGIRFSEDGGAYTIAFVPEGVTVPPPPGAAQICRTPRTTRAASDRRSTPSTTLHAAPRSTPTGPPPAGHDGAGERQPPATTATTNPTG